MSIKTFFTVSTDEELGEYVIKNNLHPDIAKLSASSLPLLSRAVLGKWKREQEGGIFIGNQYVQAGEYELPKIYDGKKLPEREPEEPYVFRVCITNPAVEKGKKTQWITLPIARVEADKAAKSLGVKKIEDCVCVIFESEIPQLTELKIEKMADFSSLNALAEQYLKLTSDNRMKYKAVLCRDNKIGLSDALLEMQYLGQYQFDMIAKSKEDYFWIYLCRHLDGDIDKTILCHMNMEKSGEVLQSKTGAVITSYGAISALGSYLYPTVLHRKKEPIREEKMQMVDLFGQKALFSEKRWIPDELPDQLFHYELRKLIIQYSGEQEKMTN